MLDNNIFSTYAREFIAKLSKYSKIYQDGFFLNNFLSRNKIQTIFDVGANEGQWSISVFRFGYKKRIISFEPQKSAHEKLVINSKKYSKWVVHEAVALGNINGFGKINISDNSVSSSIKTINITHLKSSPNARIVKTEKIKLVKLDSIFSNYFSKDDIILLKIDTQGFEKEVLEGSLISLSKISAILIELSLTELYEKQDNWINIINFLENNGFKVFKLFEGFKDKVTGQVLQVDCLLIK